MRKLYKRDILRLHPRTIEVIGQCIVEAIRYAIGDIGSFDLLQPCEKAIIGVKLERLILTKLRLPANNKHLRLDTMIKGVPIDIKFSLSNNWQISNTQLNYYCLLVGADILARTFDVGLIRARHRYMTNSASGRKFSLSKYGKSKIRWLTKNKFLPGLMADQNILIHGNNGRTSYEETAGAA